MEQQQITISVEVRSGAARFKVGVQAPSIRKALSIVGSRYPRGGVRVVFPPQPESFLVREQSALKRMAVSEQLDTQAA